MLHDVMVKKKTVYDPDCLLFCFLLINWLPLKDQKSSGKKERETFAWQIRSSGLTLMAHCPKPKVFTWKLKTRHQIDAFDGSHPLMSH